MAGVAAGAAAAAHDRPAVVDCCVRFPLGFPPPPLSSVAVVAAVRRRPVVGMCVWRAARKLLFYVPTCFCAALRVVVVPAGAHACCGAGAPAVATPPPPVPIPITGPSSPCTPCAPASTSAVRGVEVGRAPDVAGRQTTDDGGGGGGNGGAVAIEDPFLSREGASDAPSRPGVETNKGGFPLARDLEARWQTPRHCLPDGADTGRWASHPRPNGLGGWVGAPARVGSCGDPLSQERESEGEGGVTAPASAPRAKGRVSIAKWRGGDERIGGLALPSGLASGLASACSQRCPNGHDTTDRGDPTSRRTPEDTRHRKGGGGVVARAAP